MKAAWIALLIMVACGAWAQSQPPSPTPTKISQVHQSKAQPHAQDAPGDQRGTAASPVVVKVLPAEENPNKAAKEEYRQQHQTTMNDVYVETNIAIAFFTLVIAGFTVGLWWTGRDTAKRQLRAYVSVSDVNITGVKIGSTPEAIVTFKNFGQTPAYSLSQIDGIGMGRSFDTLGPATGHAGKTIASLAPGAPPIETRYKLTRELTQEDMDGLENRQLTIWVYGCMSYKDVFKNTWVTNFRLHIGGDAGMHGEQMAVCEEGNEET